MTVAKSVGLVAAAAAALAAAPVCASTGAQPVLSWTSRDEAGVYGYIVYRADVEAGPFRRLNPRIIAREQGGEAGAAAAQHYRYVDLTAQAGHDYFYYIDVIAESGRKQRLTGVVRKSAGVSGAAPEKPAGR